MLETSIGKPPVISTETVEVVALFNTINITCLIQTLKQTTIQERDFGKQIDYFLFADGKQFSIAVECLDIAFAGSSKLSGIAIFILYSTVQCAEEKVL